MIFILILFLADGVHVETRYTDVEDFYNSSEKAGEMLDRGEIVGYAYDVRYLM